jgi:glycosyltransferase involved in cell wall biosynthesis
VTLENIGRNTCGTNMIYLKPLQKSVRVEREVMQHQIKISVVIPVYNAENYIDELFGSILGQSLKEIEVVCVDDGSIDKTRELLKEYKEKDARIVVIEQENKGTAAASNAGLYAARGEYIFFVDCDDTVAAGALEKSYSLACRYKADMVLFNAEYVFEDQLEDGLVLEDIKRTSKLRTGYEKYNPTDGPTLFSIMSANKDYRIPLWRYLFKKFFLDANEICFTDGILHQDVEFSFKANMLAENVAFCEDVFYYHRIRQGSVLTTKNPRRDEYSHIIVQKKMQDFLVTIKVELSEEAFIAANGYLANRRKWILNKCLNYFIVNQSDKDFMEAFMTLDDNGDISAMIDSVIDHEKAPSEISVFRRAIRRFRNSFRNRIS